MSNAAAQSSTSLDESTLLPAARAMTFRLRLLLREVTFDADEVTIGRGDDCAMSIDDGLLSRRHAAILRRGPGFELTDLGSRNGTRLNGQRVRTPTPLRDGDRIRLGASEIVFVRDDARLDEAPQRRLATARYVACLVCQQARPADMLSCPGCGAVSPELG
jgi:hypothetical protein